jgi:hypothetical protein
MNKINILSAGLLAAAGVALLAPSVRAQDVTYTAGDLLLGFEKPGSTNDYVVDLGPATEFVTLSESPGTTDLTTFLSLGNIAADLASSSGFGSNWATTAAFGSNLQWGVFGAIGNFGALGLQPDTIFLTQAEPIPGTRSTAPTELNSSTQGDVLTGFNSFSQNGFNNETDTANSTVATFITAASGDSWSINNPSNQAFGLGYGIEQSQSDSSAFVGPTNSELDLYELVPTDEGGTGHATDLGSLTLDSSGNLDFNSAAVPEPSTYAAIGIGAVFLLLFRRTRKPHRA